MRYLIVALLCLVCAFGAHADNNNTATSKDYVDAQIATLQDEIPAIDSNTVLTHTGTSGEIGSKKIYDQNSDYASQQNALVTAGIFNSAVQNAIDSEFVCIDWLGEHVPGNCLLWKIRAATPKTIVPSGYTQLEYITNEGFSFVDTNINQKNGIGIRIMVQFPEHVYGSGLEHYQYAIGAYTPGDYIGIWKPANNVLHMCYHADIKQVATSDTAVHDIRVNYFNNQSFVFDGQQIAVLAETKTKNKPTIRLFQTNEGPVFTGQVSLHLAQITDGNTVVFNGIPVKRNSDSALGFYDMVSGNFIAGVGTFVAGPEISSNLYLPSGE